VFVTHRVETLRQGAGATQMLQLDTETIGGVANVVPRLRQIE
jgi:hypothetical protein